MFLYLLLVVVDCFASLAMTKGVKGGDFFLFSVFVFVISGCGLLRFARNDEGNKRQHPHTVIARVAFASRSNLVILGSSLREPKVRGNLGMEHYDSQTKFCGNP